MMSEDDITGLRMALAAAIENGLDTSEAVIGLLYASVPFSTKFQVINFCDLLTNNAQSAGSLKRLIQALSILEKYARHLMKPAESRSNMWRHIKYSNNIFRERVNSVQGGRYVMYQMGYTENRQDGVAFPDGVEPNHDRILHLLTDLVLGRKELELFLERQHPNPGGIEQYLTPNLRAALDESEESNVPSSQQGMVPGLGNAYVQYQSSAEPPAGSMQPSTNQMPPFSQLTNQSIGSRPQPTGLDNTQMSRYSTPNLVTRSEVTQNYPDNSQLQRMPSHMQEAYGYSMVPKQYPSGQGQFQGVNIQSQFEGRTQHNQGELPSISKQGQGPVSGIMQQGQGPITMQQGQAPVAMQQGQGPAAGIMQQGQGPVAGIMQQGQGHVAGIMQQGQGQLPGMNRHGLGLEIPPQQQQRQTGHNEPVQNTQIAEGCKDTEGKIPSIACDICGDNYAIVICRMCDNKPLCKGCDTKWHNHPKRQNHTLEYLDSAASEISHIHPPASEISHIAGSGGQNTGPGRQGMPGSRPMSMYTMPRDPQQHDRLRYTSHGAMQGQPMGQTQQPNINLHQYNVNSSQYDMMGQSSNIPPPSPAHSEQLNNHMPSSFLYHQQSMMPYAVQQGQPLPYRSPPMVQGHVAQYPVSYMPTMYMPQQQPPQMSMQGLLTPVGSSNADMPRVQNSRASTLPRPASAQSSSMTPMLVQNVRPSITSPKISESPSISSMSSGSTNTSGPGSELLPGIMAIPNLEKRMSKLEISMMTLKDDLRDWEETINGIILQNPNFFQDEEYKKLNRKKRKHLQEINELQKYQVDLEKVLEEKVEREKMEESDRRKETEVEVLRRRFHQMQASGNHDQPGITAFEMSNQQENTVHQNYIKPVSKQEGTSQKAPVPTSSGPSAPTGLVPAGPVTTTYRPQQFSKQQKSTIEQNLGDENCPPLLLNSLGDGDDLPEAIKKMLVLDQNPFSQTPGRLNDSTRKTDQAVPAEIIRFPPEVAKAQVVNREDWNKAAGLRKGNSEPNLQHGLIVQEGMAIKKSQSSADIPKWQCEHCTFLNDYSDKACSICFKTSDNPRRIEPNMPAVTEESSGGENAGIHCEHCTFYMQPGTRVCPVCDKTQTRNQSQKSTTDKNPEVRKQNPQAEAVNQSVGEKQRSESQSVGEKQRSESQSVGEKQRSESQSTTDATEVAGYAVAASAVGRLIEEEQDQVYLEKKAARERFERMNRSPGELAPKGAEVKVSGVQEGAVAVSKGIKYDSDQTNIEVVGERPRIEQSVQGTPIQAEITPYNKDIEKIKKPSSGSSSSYNSAASSLEELGEPKVKPGNQGVAMGTGKASKAPPQLNFVEAIEQINLKREQEQMSLDGHEVMNILKEGERLGYDVKVVQIALTRSIEDKLQPLDWLKSKWQDLVEIVVTMATEEGKTADQNDVGDVSEVEARTALIESAGDIEQAVGKCVRDRQAKYLEISKCGEYAREDILTALYQNDGDMEEAVDQLNHFVIKNYEDRLWDTNENRGGEAAIAAAARSAELSNSVSNSVIGHAAFQRLVSDISIDKDRRVRMVFVEGKLKSWGRAETVVTIVDCDITESREPLECTLEDIIEAVRNCGDRKSSLVYLTQECGICYARVPMSKIRDLGVCRCKLCQGCVKQFFEVAIRERYVRNWCCPLCEAPGMEDESRTTEYFEFLSLILQNLVSREVMELYETKLRDWHLQKDPNFRWCAHCASGFIWDRPDILGMACPHCHQKTCFMCKIKWEEQHEGLTCEGFAQWRIDNDPEKQAKGVKLYLEENGIDCPSCKMRYSLAKGGCMHFKCPQCGYEFCSGCSQAFLHQEACKLLKSCKGKGLHCHHPRDCFYYMRDSEPVELQRLLKDHRVVYNTDVPATQEDKNHCPVMEQKEYGPQKKDEPCGKDTKKGMAGLCEDHYKEYLVGMINKNKIDPVAMMSLMEMKILVERNEKEMPKRNLDEAEGQYKKRVLQFIKERWQLRR